MDILESLVTLGNAGAAGYLVASGNENLALYSGTIAISSVILDGTINYLKRKQEARDKAFQDSWNIGLSKLKSGY